LSKNDSEEDDPFAEMFDEDEKYDHDVEENQQEQKIKKIFSHRGTFVGTPLYATPEMLDASVSGPFTDLWALGVIAY